MEPGGTSSSGIQQGSMQQSGIKQGGAQQGSSGTQNVPDQRQRSDQGSYQRGSFDQSRGQDQGSYQQPDGYSQNRGQNLGQRDFNYQDSGQNQPLEQKGGQGHSRR